MWSFGAVARLALGVLALVVVDLAPGTSEARRIDSDQTCAIKAERSGCTGGPRCGNGIVEAREECDDGGTVPGDGCNATCEEESCVEIVCNDNDLCTTDSLDPLTGECEFEAIPNCAPPHVLCLGCVDDADACTDNSCIVEATAPNPDAVGRLFCDSPELDPARRAACEVTLAGVGFYCFVSDRRTCPDTPSGAPRTCDAATGQCDPRCE